MKNICVSLMCFGLVVCTTGLGGTPTGNILGVRHDFRLAFFNQDIIEEADKNGKVLIDSARLARVDSFRTKFGAPMNKAVFIHAGKGVTVEDALKTFTDTYGVKLGSFLKDPTTVVKIVKKREIYMGTLGEMKGASITLVPGDLIILEDIGDLW